MIRVVILADTATRAHSLAEILTEDADIEVLYAGRPNDDHEPIFADVVLYAGLDNSAVDSIATPTVILAKSGVEPRWSQSVRGWLSLEAEPLDVIAAVRAASQNLTVLTHQQASRWLPAAGRRKDPGAFEEQLTARELQVLRLLADGMGNKEIAASLRVSDHTAKSHVAQILAKLGAVSRAEAVALGIKRGLVPL